MTQMRFFIDTHDRSRGTFPKELSVKDFETFFEQYLEACAAEGVVVLRSHLSLEDGRAFCFNMAPDADAVRRAHARVDFPFDSITEVTTATPGDIFFHRAAEVAA
jgi:Nickel responsive protein SCO4226-like